MRSSPGTDDQTPAEPVEPSGEELRAQLEQARAELAAAEDRFLRARADLDNYRKRIERELERRVHEQGDEHLREWLDVVDSVERAVALEPERAEGLRALLDQIDALLSRQGVVRIGESGEQFDPAVHEAVAAVPDSGRPAGTIVDVARAGYSVDDRVVRPAQVAVAR